MHFEPGYIYHIYNRGHKDNKVFFTPANKRYFLSKVQLEWDGLCTILAYCLLPTTFHFLIIPNDEACEVTRLKGKESNLQLFSRALGTTLSSYARAMNRSCLAKGSVFRKKTRSRMIKVEHDYLVNRIRFIHEAPVRKGLVSSAGEWEFSSWNEYAGQAVFELCDRERCFEVGGFSGEAFLKTVSPLKPPDTNLVSS